MLTKIYRTKVLKEIVTKEKLKIHFHQNVTTLSFFLINQKAVDCQLHISLHLALALFSDSEYTLQ